MELSFLIIPPCARMTSNLAPKRLSNLPYIIIKEGRGIIPYVIGSDN